MVAKQQSSRTQVRRYLPNRVVTSLRPEERRRRRIVETGISVEGLPLRRTVRGSVWGVTMVRNEADIVALTIRHHLEQGLAGIIVVDNLSEDGTPDILAELARDERVYFGRDRVSAYWQGEKMTHLTYLAARAGADWVVPFDGDECWYAHGATVGDFLVGAQADVVVAQLHNVLPNPAEDAITFAERDSVRVSRFPVAEAAKVAFRAYRYPVVGYGNHNVYGVYGPRIEGLSLLHYPYRSLAQLRAKVRAGAAALRAADLGPEAGSHWRALDTLDEAGLDKKWDDYLYDGGGMPGQAKYELVDVIAPWSSWPTWDPRRELVAERPT